MSISFLAVLMTLYQASTASERPAASADDSLKIWEEIAQIESELHRTINQEGTLFMVAAGDPVRGYFVDKVGVLFLVPVRFRGMTNQKSVEGKKSVGSKDSLHLGNERIDVESKMREWRDWLAREETTRDSEFEKIVKRVRELIPMALSRLKHLESAAGLTVVIEEREPAWYASQMSIQQRETRKIVTLQVANEIIAKVQANETVFPREWLNEIKRTTNNRANTRF